MAGEKACLGRESRRRRRTKNLQLARRLRRLPCNVRPSPSFPPFPSDTFKAAFTLTGGATAACIAKCPMSKFVSSSVIVTIYFGMAHFEAECGTRVPPFGSRQTCPPASSSLSERTKYCAVPIRLGHFTDRQMSGGREEGGGRTKGRTLSTGATSARLKNPVKTLNIQGR